jgi:hypothetical protein
MEQRIKEMKFLPREADSDKINTEQNLVDSEK